MDVADGFIRVEDIMGDDLSVIRAARVSYGSQELLDFDEKKDGRLLAYLLRNNHWSPFEHAVVTFHVKLPIFVARQWMRHRSWSFNEISGRYKELPLEFYRPLEWRTQAKDNKQGSGEPLGDLGQMWSTDAYNDALDAVAYVYEGMLDGGVARELARMILPVSTYTEFYATANLRSILHFLQLRDDSHSQLEIQEYAKAMKTLLTPLFPHTLDAWSKLRLSDQR